MRPEVGESLERSVTQPIPATFCGHSDGCGRRPLRSTRYKFKRSDGVRERRRRTSPRLRARRRRTPAVRRERSASSRHVEGEPASERRRLAPRARRAMLALADTPPPLGRARGAVCETPPRLALAIGGGAAKKTRSKSEDEKHPLFIMSSHVSE